MSSPKASDVASQSPPKRRELAPRRFLSAFLGRSANNGGSKAKNESRVATQKALREAAVTAKQDAAALGPPLGPSLPPIGKQSFNVEVVADGATFPSSPKPVPRSCSEVSLPTQALVSWNLVVTDRCPPELARGKEHGWSKEHFELSDEPIGQGKASHVFSARCKTSGVRCALKQYRKMALSRTSMNQVQREVTIHSRLQHPNIIDLYAAFEDAQCVYLVLEYAELGDVFNWLQHKVENAKIDNEGFAVRGLFLPVMRALLHLHERGYIHRDIKPENLLIASDGTVKLADFGLSMDLELERPCTRLGTLDYMAPEVIMAPERRSARPSFSSCTGSWDAGVSEGMYDAKVDVWAVGVLVFEALCGVAPFEDRSPEQKSYKIVHVGVKPPKFISDAASDFIVNALQKDPEKRLTLHEMFMHRFIRVNADIRQTANFDMRKALLVARFGMKQIKEEAAIDPLVTCSVVAEDRSGLKEFISAPGSPSSVASFPPSPSSPSSSARSYSSSSSPASPSSPRSDVKGKKGSSYNLLRMKRVRKQLFT